VASLRELQHQFAAALRRSPGDNSVAPAVRPAANLDVYRHNAAHQFHNALSISYPVVRRRVGEDFFRQLVHHYRARFPSRSGDLQWVGRDFPAFLATHLADTDYAWLADLARLEWAREIAGLAQDLPPLGVEKLGQFAAEDLARLVFALQPSLALVASPFPVFSVWTSNQRENAPPVDQSLGPENILILGRSESVEMRRVAPGTFSYLCALAGGAPLGEAVSAGGLDEAGLLTALQFSFTEGLVCGLSLPD
jgi:Putative DNA-binding domain